MPDPSAQIDYRRDARERISAIVIATGAPMPMVIEGPRRISGRTIVLPALASDCPADHVWEGWEVAEIWRGCAMEGAPEALQRALARYRMPAPGEDA